MTTTSSGKQAVILSGGGADGAYEIGVMKALFTGQSKATDHRPLAPDIFTGTSVGSYNAAFLVSQWERYGPAAIANLEHVWLNELAGSLESCGNGAYRIRGNPLELLNPRCLASHPIQSFIHLAEDSASLAWDGLQRAVNFVTTQEGSLAERLVEWLNISSFISRQPLEQTLSKTIRFDSIRRSQKMLSIAATDWATGTLEIFENHDMTDQSGPLVLMASSALPGFFQPTAIGAHPYVDGGVLMNTPLRPAIHAGAETLHVIYMDPDVKNIPLAHVQNTLTTMYRMLTIAWAAAINDDIKDAETINQGLKILQRVAQGAPVNDQNAENFIKTAALFAGRLLRYKLLTIHRYHPRDDLGGFLGFLNFRRERIARLIERGFDDAVYHDCDDNQCILPNIESPAEMAALENADERRE